ncbi:MAG: bifunctional precorrin-2 dehydrogenase/sirohydrochlorin ferrochelatase [Chloroflexi bacterium]|nr:bifunctional precorrin-2 dehydrogenase/sirohydrochlorin ferrochelatase [Chloroflexota bacterium]
MRYYPVFLDVQDKPVVIAGGGHVAHQKLGGLIDAGARVTLISPELSAEVQQFVDDGKVTHINREYQDGDMEGYFLAFVATDDGAINKVVADEARSKRVWINAVDDVPNCDFIMPAVVRQGELVLAISTSGESPAMARKVREDIEEFLGEDDAELLSLAAEVRRELQDQGVVVKDCDRCDRNHLDVWNAALDAEVKTLVGDGHRDQAKERLLKSLFAPSGST